MNLNLRAVRWAAIPERIRGMFSLNDPRWGRGDDNGATDVKPDAPNTKSTLRHAGFPDNAIIGGIVRGDKVFIPDADFRINAYDRAVVFSLPGAIPKIGKYFN